MATAVEHCFSKHWTFLTLVAFLAASGHFKDAPAPQGRVLGSTKVTDLLDGLAAVSHQEPHRLAAGHRDHIRLQLPLL